MTRRALHMLAPNEKGDGREAGRRALCGGTDRYGKQAGDLDTTPEAVAVTCRHCMRRLVDAQAKAALVRVETAIGERPPGAHDAKLLPLDRGSRAIIERSIRGEVADVGPRWSSLDRALEHESRVVLDGAPVRSSSDTDRFGVLPQRSVGEVPTPAALAGREDVLAVRVAIERAARACVEAVEVGAIGIGVVLTEADFSLVLRWLSQGQPVWQRIADGRKGGIWRAIRRTRADVAEELARRHGREVTERQVEIAEKAMRQSAEEALRRAGELRAARPRKERETMAAPEGWDVEGWVAIGKVVGRGADTCQALEKREENPLPVERYSGRVIARREDLRAWVAREIARAKAA